jgi:anti-sigma factor RsiW
VTCQETQNLLHGYIDGELDLIRNIEIEQHMNDCQTCSLAREEQVALREVISESSLYFVAPDGLQRRVKTALRAVNSQKATPWLMSRRWLTIAASAAVLALSGIVIWTILSGRTRSNADDLVAQEVVSSHVRSLMASHLTDVVSSDQHTVKPWFDGKLDFAPPVKDITGQGFPLVGGRLDYIGNRAVAALVHQRQNHYINLFVWPSTGDTKQPEQILSRQGYNLIHWDKSGMTFWAVSDLNTAEFREFVRLWQD